MKHFVCFNLLLATAFATLTAMGCGGVKLVPIGERVRNADRQFDAAEAFRVTSDQDAEQEKWREQVQQKKALYDETLNSYRAIAKAEPTGKFAQRSLWQISDVIFANLPKLI